MSISFDPLFTQLRTDSLRVSEYETEIKSLRHQHELLSRLNQEVSQELSAHDTFNWEFHPTNRALLDEIYDLELLENVQGRTYAFTETQEMMDFMQKIRGALETKASEVQDKHQFHAKQRDEFMQFYQLLLELISKLSSIIASVTQRI